MRSTSSPESRSVFAAIASRRTGRPDGGGVTVVRRVVQRLGGGIRR
jgi:hypothetical protein